MTTIEENMQIYFKNERENKTTTIEPKKEIDIKEPITVEVPYDEPKDKRYNIKPSYKIPFANVSNIALGSPAEESGLIEGDQILNFDNLVYKGAFTNPLQKIAEIVGKKVNKEIIVEISRTGENEERENLTLKLIPHHWSGQGVLGCKLNLLDK
jgi:membrane-associated protease RseP (regulator of RpoE activity)